MILNSANDTQDVRSLLQDRLNPIAVQFGNVIERKVMVFLYPAVAERDPGYIKYHGMPIAEEIDMIALEELSGKFSSELTRIRNKTGTLDELIAEMQRLEAIWNDAINKSTPFEVCKSALDRSL